MDMNQNVNNSIHCNVNGCKYHTSNDFCSLDSINVVTSSTASNVSSPECTDCGSFMQK